MFEYERVLFLEINEPDRISVECQATYRQVPIRTLLLGVRPLRLERVIERFEAEVQHGIGDIKEELQKIDDRLTASFEFLRSTTKIQQSLATRCPSVFTVTATPRTMHFGDHYKIRLFCEEPGAWHPMPDDQGLFIYKGRPKWLVASAPYLRVLVKIMDAALPLVKPGAALFDDQLSTDVQNELELMKTLVSKLPDPRRKELSSVSARLADLPRATAASYADFVSLRQMFEKLRPQGDVWGGLEPVVRPERDMVIFVCAQHRAHYLYPQKLAMDNVE